MGLFGRLLSSMGDDSTDESCPSCGATLESDGTYGRGLSCPSCADGVVYRVESGSLNAYGPSTSSGDNDCESCQASLSGGVRYLPYEDGSNSTAYIVCPSCGHHNDRYGFGEDD